MGSMITVEWPDRLDPTEYRTAVTAVYDALADAGLADGLTVRTDATTASSEGSGRPS